MKAAVERTRRACAAAGLALAALGCGGGPAEQESEVVEPPTVALCVLRGFELDDLERATKLGLFPEVTRWRPLAGGGPTTTASVATLLSGALPAEHGVVSVRDHGAHHVSPGVHGWALPALVENLEASWNGPVAATLGLEAGPTRTEDPPTPIRFELLVFEREGSAVVPTVEELSVSGESVTSGARSTTGAWERWFPAEDGALRDELGAELHAEVTEAAAARDAELLLQRIGRRRGSVARARLEGLGDDLWLERASATLEQDTDVAVVVALPRGDSDVPSRAWLGLTSADTVTGLDACALHVVASARGAWRARAQSEGEPDPFAGVVPSLEQLATDPRSEPPAAPAPASGLALRVGPGHVWELELEVDDATLTDVTIDGGQVVGQREQRLSVRFEGAGTLEVGLSRRAAPVRLSVQRDGQRPPRAALLVGEATAAEAPLPELVRSGASDPNEEQPTPRVSVVGAGRDGYRLEASSVDLNTSRAGSWPPSVRVGPIGEDAAFARPRSPARLALALVIDGRVLAPGELALDGSRPAPDALELVLPGGDDVALARAAAFGPSDRTPAEGELFLRRLGPIFAPTAQLDDEDRRRLDRLPEGW